MVVVSTIFIFYEIVVIFILTTMLASCNEWYQDFWCWMLFLLMLSMEFYLLFVIKKLIFCKHSLIYNFKKIPYKNIKLIELDCTRYVRYKGYYECFVTIYTYNNKKSLFIGFIYEPRHIELKLKKICMKKCIKCKLRS